MKPPLAVLRLVPLLLLLGAPAALSQGAVDFSASGTLRDPAGAPVPCCDVRVEVREPGGGVFSVQADRTDSAGRFEVEGLGCNEALALEVVAIPLCCDGETAPLRIPGCADPGGGGPLEHLDFGDVTCLDAPVTGRTLLSGRTLCRDGVFLEPVADCGVRLLAEPGLGEPGAFTWTEADGAWELCAECEPGTVVQATVEAQCCGLFEVATLDDCPEAHEFPDFVCDPCPTPPCPVPRDIEYRGRVVCPDPAGGPPVPVPGCEVEVFAFNDCMERVGPVTVVTASDGTWNACLPCPAGGACSAGAGWQVQATPACCPNGFLIETQEGCPPVVQLSDNVCPLGPLGDCALNTGCPTGQSRVAGVVTCPDPSGTPVPVPDCAIEIRCPGGTAIETTTGPDGSYEACVPCMACDFVTVTALCCGEILTVDLLGCPATASADLSCASCPPPPRPCPAPDAVRVSGRVACEQGDGTRTPLAGCAVSLEPVSATGLPLDAVPATTEGDGSFVACVPCGPDGLGELTARATCCGVETTVPVASCPETLDLGALLCADCSPCPTGMTRLQGRVHCRGAGPVEGCRVRVNLSTCAGEELLFATTDRQGRYRLCIPCPCPGTVVRVTSECCRGTSVRVIDDCGPTTPMRTIHCGGACP